MKRLPAPIVIMFAFLAGTLFLLRVPAAQATHLPAPNNTCNPAATPPTQVDGRCAGHDYYSGADMPLLGPFKQTFGRNPVTNTSLLEDNITGSNTRAQNTEAFIALIQQWLYWPDSNGSNNGRLNCEAKAIIDPTCQEYLAHIYGSAFYIETMLGVSGQTFQGGSPTPREAGLVAARTNFNRWANIVRIYNANNWVRWIIPINYLQPHLNSLGFNNGEAVAFYVNDSPEPNLDSIVFYDPADGTTPIYEIKKYCGNVSGVAQPLKLFDTTIQPTAPPPTLSPDDESPTSATFTSNINVNIPGTVPNKIHDVTVDRRYFVRRGATDYDITVPSPATDWTDTQDYTNSNNQLIETRPIPPAAVPGGLQTGDKVCIAVSTEWSSAQFTPSGDFVAGTGTRDPAIANTGAICTPVVDKPFTKIFDSDVFVGGGFTGSASCNVAGTADLSGYYRSGSSGQAGSGAQFAALVGGQITGFPNAIRNSTASLPAPPYGLSFSNTLSSGTGTVNALSGLLGGGFGGVGFGGGGTNCITDYYALHTFTSTGPDQCVTNTGAPKVLPLDTGNSVGIIDYDDVWTTCYKGFQRIAMKNGISSRFGNGGTIFHSFIFINGDAYIGPSNPGGVSINPGIFYANTTWANPESIPVFYLVVSGNIYIDPAVNNLDGVYIAQPRIDGSGHGGTIYTCAGLDYSTDPKGVINTYSSVPDYKKNFINNGVCHDKQLTVNGTFIAQKIVLDRTINSLRNDPITGSDFNSTNASERFGLSPEIYMANICQDSLVNVLCSSSSAYDAITSLPPIL